jgi:DNA invertase Pin-like site-specific DNA recombinase
MVDKTIKARNNVPLGVAHGMAKLTAATVLEIRANAAYGCLELARRYGIAHQTVSKILRRVSWKHI